MGAIKISDEQIGVIKCFLRKSYSITAIQKELRQQGWDVSRASISRVRNDKLRSQKNKDGKENRGRKSKLTQRKIKWLNKELLKTDPPTQKHLANKLEVNERTVRYYIKKFGLKKVKKPKCHAISEKSRQKRYRRSWPMYLRLKKEYRKIITGDEAWFYINDGSGQRSIQYISRSQNRSDCTPFRRASNSKGVMIWAAISCQGKAKLRFIQPGCKINAKYYIDKVLKPFIKQDFFRLYPDGDGVFHQDSAPAHAAKSTQDYLRRNDIPFITPEQWMPNSPDAAPCDFFYGATLNPN